MPTPNLPTRRPHELTQADLDRFPLWEYTTEDPHGPCVRPYIPEGPLPSCDTFYGFIAADFITRRGRQLVGTIQTGAHHSWPHGLNACLWLDRPAEQLTPDPLLSGYNPMIRGSSICFSLPLTRYFSDAKARPFIALAYQILAVSADEFFPLTVRPRHPIEGWPPTFKLPGFLRPREPDNPGDVLS